ncbi:hypothetical protein [Paracoccus onubensis]|uniref:hypothetical protein n=1 Tax=Paracoccus onubensis TaxID=1675788 RepID=UPI0016047032|nr:hypothetical protein [Paracoccus onubensis]
MILSTDTKTVLSFWDANAYYPEDAFDYVRCLRESEVIILQKEIQALMQADDMTRIISRLTGFQFKSAENTRSFLKALKGHLFSAQPVPEIAEYL